MKPQIVEHEGPIEIAPGKWAADTGDPWHCNMPDIFWTTEARRLFKAAVDVGILVYIDEADYYAKGVGLTKAQLAYWCKKASTYLGIDRGGTTNWRPFEIVFGTPARIDTLTGEKVRGSSALKNCLHNLDETGCREAYIQPIDDFFGKLEDTTNEK